MAEVLSQKVLKDFVTKHAGGMYEKKGVHMAWWKRFVVCFFVDALDWANLIIWWLPGVHKITGAAIDLVQMFFVTMVLGPNAFSAQLLEGVLGLIPFGGVFLEAFPTSLATCFVMWVAERNQRTNKPTTWRDFEMEFLFGILGFLFGILMWMGGWTPIHWSVGIMTLGIFLASMRRFEIPRLWIYIGCSAAILAFIVSLIGLWRIGDAESYRIAAWHQLEKEEDPQIVDAIRADAAKPDQTPETSQSWGQVITDVIGVSREDLHKSVEERTPFKNPVLEAMRKRVVKLTAPKPPKAPQQTNTKRQPDKLSTIQQKISADAAALSLGLEQTELYGSDYVLDRAKRIYQDKSDYWIWWFRFTRILALFGVLATVQVFFSSSAEKSKEANNTAASDAEGS